MPRALKTHRTVVGEVEEEVLAFTVGKDLTLDLALAECDCIGSAAHVTMLSRLKGGPRLFSPTERDRVIRELVAIMRRVRRGAFRIRAQDQDVHLAIEQELTRTLGDLGKRIHTARSRNDQVAVDLRLYGKEQLLGLMEEALSLAGGLFRLARHHRSVPMVGRTHMQPAMPSSVGLWASAHGEALLDDYILLQAAFDYNDRCPLGSAAGYGVPLRIDRLLTSRLLGFAAPNHNVLHASNTRGQCESVLLGAAAQVMLSLSRLAEDTILYSMPEFGYFSLPAAFCTGSSIMPQKRNPDVLELVRAKASRVLGGFAAAAGIVCGLPGGYNRDLQEVKEPFIEGLGTVRACLRILTSIVGGLGVDRTALRKAFTPEVFAADRALQLVAQGVPFRDAYHRVKATLGALKSVDPDEAVARKTHWGAPAGLDLALLEGRMRRLRHGLRRTRATYCGAISKLLGVRYPAMGDGETVPGKERS